MKKNGFTLIELMITVAVIGILATIAYPSYQDQIRRTRRADAEASLSQLANFMERQFTELNCYKSLGADNLCGTADDAAPDLTGPTAQLANTTNFYTVSFSAITATSYTLQAAAIAGKSQASDSSCTTLTLDNIGNKTPANCW